MGGGVFSLILDVWGIVLYLLPIISGLGITKVKNSTRSNDFLPTYPTYGLCCTEVTNAGLGAKKFKQSE